MKALCGALVTLALVQTGRAQVIQDDFSKGVDAPMGWALREGRGQWDPAVGSKRTVSVTGSGEDMSYWARAVPGLKPNSLYAFRFRAKASPGAGAYTVISGLDVCNRDFASTQNWSNYSFVFATPSDVSSAFMRLGQWHLKGTVSFSNVALLPVTAVHSAANGVTLGEGETVRRGVYEFRAPLAGFGSNSARCLASHTAPFNSNRWVFSGGLNVTYRHDTGKHRHLGGKVTANIGYYTGGQLVVSASADGSKWREVGRAATPGEHRFTIPSSVFPADAVYIRLEGASTTDPAGNSAPGAFQIDGYQYEANLEGEVADAVGATTYVQVRQQTPGLTVGFDDVGGLGRVSDGALMLRLTPDRANAGELAAVLSIRTGKAPQPEEFADAVQCAAGRPTSLTVPYRVKGVGDIRAVLTVARVEGGRQRTLYSAEIEAYMPPYFAADYGRSLTPVPDGELWWCESTYKVPPDRLPPPQEHDAGLADIGAVRGAGAIQLTAARREREHAQLVFRPSSDPGPVEVTVSDLVGPGTRRLPASAVEVREAAYVRVTQPTDRTGVAAEWPDPLPPLDGPWKPMHDRNNALWLTVTVPSDAAPGDYAGIVTLKSPRWKREIALRLHVWSFTLPEMTSLRSGFGVQPGMISRYHNLKNPDDLARVWDLYMEAFRKRRIAPYNPMALAPYRVEVGGLRWSGGTRDRVNPGSGLVSLRVEDASPVADAAATYTDPVPIEPGKRYRLSWKCRTGKPAQGYMITVSHLDGGRQWMYGRNNDIVRTGSGQWQDESVEVSDRFPAEARFVQIVLRPTVWTEQGENMGTAWFDDVELREIPREGTGNAETGPSLLMEGGFEAEPTLEARLDFTDFDKAAERYLDGMGFNAFTVSIQGLPGGRHPNFDRGSFFGFGPDTPEYDALMRDYGGKLEAHLAEKGWLDKAYVYWYDEPEEQDYPIVKEGAARLKRYFPRIKRMMTEQFEKPLFGSVDLWCPISFLYDRDAAWARQKLGEEVWWYVCTGPKEPYCTLFIDKPAIELRMWLWQTWQRRIQGILIWETTWWTSSQQFPDDRVQNPWDDPMAYVGGPSGVWGNGDGRFFYPPNRAPNTDRETVYRSGPIDSIRWEMLGEGIEDWEYFRILDAAVRKAERSGRNDAVVKRARGLLDVPPSITSDATHFTTDPRLLYRHRVALAEAIEALTQ